MVADYNSLKFFITKNILEQEIHLNPLEKTQSVIESITERFKRIGWKVSKVPNPTDRVALHRLTSPNNSVALRMRGGKVYRHSGPTEAICKYKNFTKMMLQLDGVPVPQGADFLGNQRGVALAYFGKLPKPAVIKPTDAAGSRGVTVGIRNVKSFVAAWDKALADGRENSKIIVEQFVPGIELRAYVVGDSTVSIVARIQPYIIGNGTCTVAELINLALDERKINYRTETYGIDVDWKFVHKQGFHEHTVPEQGEIIFLNPFSTGAVGGLAVEVTDRVSPKIRDMAVRAKNSVPGLEVAGIDILTSTLDDPNTAYVLEINTAPSPDLHRYATHGTPRSVDADVVQYFHAEYLKSQQQ